MYWDKYFWNDISRQDVILILSPFKSEFEELWKQNTLEIDILSYSLKTMILWESLKRFLLSEPSFLE